MATPGLVSRGGQIANQYNVHGKDFIFRQRGLVLLLKQGAGAAKMLSYRRMVLYANTERPLLSASPHI